MERKTGLLRVWNPKRCYGVVQVGGIASLERYYLYLSNIRSGTANPEVGSVVCFEPARPSNADGRLPVALRADIQITGRTALELGLPEEEKPEVA